MRVGLEDNVLDCDLVVIEFELQSDDYAYFRTNTLNPQSHWVPHSFGLVLNRSKDLRKLLPLIPSYRLNSASIILLQGQL